MATRKVEITVNGKDLSKVLKDLGVKAEDMELTLCVEMNDVKENYNYLAKSEMVKDWNFPEEMKTKEYVPEKKKETPVDKKPKTTEPKEQEKKGIREMIYDKIWTTDRPELFRNILDLTKAALEVKTKSPGWILSELTLAQVVFPEYDKIKSDRKRNKFEGLDSLVFEKIIRIYYEKSSLDTIMEDIISKLKENWKGLERKASSLRDVIKLFFGLID